MARKAIRQCPAPRLPGDSNAITSMPQSHDDTSMLFLFREVHMNFHEFLMWACSAFLVSAVLFQEHWGWIFASLVPSILFAAPGLQRESLARLRTCLRRVLRLSVGRRVCCTFRGFAVGLEGGEHHLEQTSSASSACAGPRWGGEGRGAMASVRKATTLLGYPSSADGTSAGALDGLLGANALATAGGTVRCLATGVNVTVGTPVPVRYQHIGVVGC
jgi:hypothetical protein